MSGAAVTSNWTPTAGGRCTAECITIGTPSASERIGGVLKRSAAARGDSFIPGCNHPGSEESKTGRVRLPDGERLALPN